MKPVVRFERFIGWKDHPYGKTLAALLAGVHGHPLLGYQREVTTSRVERIAYGEDGHPCEIETRNTIYRDWEPIETDGWAGEPQGREHGA